MKAVINFLLGLAVPGLTIGWLGYGLEGAGNVLAFLLWVWLFGSLSAHSEKSLAARAKEPPVALRSVNRFAHGCCVVALIWTGHFVLGAVGLLAMLFNISASMVADERRKASAA